jgi:hypothetical protein
VERKDSWIMAKTRDKVTEATGTVKPYVERALRDEELRDNIRNAYQSARSIYSELLGGKGVVPAATRFATDRDIQDELRRAIGDLRKAADRIQGKAERTGRNGALLLAGITLGVLFNPFTGPKTRKFISSRLFGDEGDFTYQPGGENGGG